MNAFFKTHWISLVVIVVLLGLLWGAISSANQLATGIENTINNASNAPAKAFTSFWTGAYNFVAGLLNGQQQASSADDSDE